MYIAVVALFFVLSTACGSSESDESLSSTEFDIAISGGNLVGAKLTAARLLGIPVFMINRPAAPTGRVVSVETDAIAWAAALKENRSAANHHL